MTGDKSGKDRVIMLILDAEEDADIIGYLEHCEALGEDVQRVIKSAINYAWSQLCVD